MTTQTDQSVSTAQVIAQHVGPCREWPPGELEMCGATAEYVLWGKLIPPEGLGPRCYRCAQKHVHHTMLGGGTLAAVVHIGDLARKIDAERVG